MGELRSAREIALDKINDIEEITQADRLRWKLVPVGEKLAQRYLIEDIELDNELSVYPPEEMPYVKQGMVPILLAALDLPRDEAVADRIQKIMAAVMQVKDDKETVAELLGQLQKLFDHYSSVGEQQRQQAYQSFKEKYEQRLRQSMREQQGADVPGQINVEQYPQFQEEWRRNLNQFERQYLLSIDQIKRQLLKTV